MTASASGTRVGQALRDLATGAVLLAVVAGGTWRLAGLTASYGVVVGALYLVLAVLLVRAAPTLPFPALGAANRVTLMRATLALPVAALALPPALGEGFGATEYWWIVGLSSLALGLDGLDGRIARSRGGESTMGARFDMELDAFLLLTLSVLLWQSGKTGPWVIGIGALRYVFVGVGWVVPALRGALPYSERRRFVCALQGVVLVVALAPVTSSAPAAVLAAGALGLLVYSFAVDVRWLLGPSR
jgi:phosphatidylglycerophosphate synthase